MLAILSRAAGGRENSCEFFGLILKTKKAFSKFAVPKGYEWKE